MGHGGGEADAEGSHPASDDSEAEAEGSPPATGDAPADLPDAIAWTVHPARERPWQCAAVVAIVVLSVVAVWYGFQSEWFAMIAAIVLPVSLLSYFAPTRYRLTEEGVEVRGPVFTDRREWSKFKTCFPDRDGVLLTPLKRPTRLAYTRGVYLRCAESKGEVETYAKQAISAARSADDE